MLRKEQARNKELEDKIAALIPIIGDLADKIEALTTIEKSINERRLP